MKLVLNSVLTIGGSGCSKPLENSSIDVGKSLHDEYSGWTGLARAIRENESAHRMFMVERVIVRDKASNEEAERTLEKLMNICVVLWMMKRMEALSRYIYILPRGINIIGTVEDTQ